MTDKNNEIAIRVNDISKAFKLPHEKQNSVKSLFINVFRSKRTYEKQQVIKNLSFEIKQGEFFGIVGRNGSGKSTLLKMLAGIYSPDKGNIEINGKLTPFIELGVGFNPELTGRENVFLNGALLGFNRSEMEEMYDEIVKFAELEKFMDQKLKNYSSGMQVRLAFSIAIRAKTDILVLDEVLAVGDEAFQRKCYQYFAEVKRQKQTVVLVTHSMDVVQQFCTRAMLIDKGHQTEIGTPLKIAQIYRELNDQDGVTVNATSDGVIDKLKKTKTKFIDMDTECTKEDGLFVFDISIKSRVEIEDPIIAMGIYRDNGEQVYRWTSDEKIPVKLDLNKRTKIRIKVDDVLPVGIFTADIFVKKRDRTVEYAVFNNVTKFEVRNSSAYKYATFWKIPDKTYVNGEEV